MMVEVPNVGYASVRASEHQSESPDVTRTPADRDLDNLLALSLIFLYAVAQSDCFGRFASSCQV